MVLRYGSKTPVLSIIVPSNESGLDSAKRSVGYFESLGRDDIELVIVALPDGISTQHKAYNFGAAVAASDKLAFTCTGVSWSNAVIDETIAAFELSSVVVGHRVDEDEDGRWNPNRYAAGDWCCIRKDVFVGFDEEFDGSAYGEFDAIAGALTRLDAIGQQMQVAVISSHVMHYYHKPADAARMRAANKANKQRSMRKGWPCVVWVWPSVTLLWLDGRVVYLFRD